LLGIFERSVCYREQAGDSKVVLISPDVVIFGIGRYGSELIKGLKKEGWNVLGIDSDPNVIRSWRTEGISVRYGDAEDSEFLATLSLQHSTWVISTVNELSVHLALLASLRHQAFKGSVAVRVNRREDAELLMHAGA
jgi:Trk K+ transport system NAD-binding subunit